MKKVTLLWLVIILIILCYILATSLKKEKVTPAPKPEPEVRLPPVLKDYYEKLPSDCYLMFKFTDTTLYLIREKGGKVNVTNYGNPEKAEVVIYINESLRNIRTKEDILKLYRQGKISFELRISYLSAWKYLPILNVLKSKYG